MARRRRRLWLLAPLAGALGLALFALADTRGLAYLSDAPEACLHCHVMREPYDAWREGPHHAAASCNGCHVPQDLPARWISKARSGASHGLAFVLQRFDEPIRITPRSAAALEANCLRCHRDFVSESAGRHPGPPADCLRCHAGVGHAATRSPSP